MALGAQWLQSAVSEGLDHNTLCLLSEQCSNALVYMETKAACQNGVGHPYSPVTGKWAVHNMLTITVHMPKHNSETLQSPAQPLVTSRAVEA